jgi:hypothetical protein
MSDTGKYLNKGSSVKVAGKKYKLRGLGLAEILSESANGLRKKRLKRPKEYADAMGLSEDQRAAFLVKWMKENPEPEPKENEEEALDFAATAEGVEYILSHGLADQSGMTMAEAQELVNGITPDELLHLSSALLGGWLDLSPQAKKKTLIQRIISAVRG